MAMLEYTAAISLYNGMIATLSQAVAVDARYTDKVCNQVNDERQNSYADVSRIHSAFAEGDS